jgi:translocation and assembly module TamB
VSLGESVVVDLDLAKANVTGAVNFDWQGDKIPVANGRYMVDGSIEAFGQVLDISEGSIRFPKVPADQPYIRVVAEREIYGNTQVKRAGVLVDGPVRRPTVEAFTQPMTTQERALTLLVTGSDFDFEQGVGAVDFGTYVAPRLFVSYGIGVFERENIISARFDLSKGFGIKASSGSKESGVDLNYRFEN